MDGGRGLADIPEACPCVFPYHHTIYRRSVSHLLGYALHGVPFTMNYLYSFSDTVGSSNYSTGHGSKSAC